MTANKQSKSRQIIFPALLSILCIVLTIGILSVLFLGNSFGGLGMGQASANLDLLDRFDIFITNTISNAVEGVMHVDKVYVLNDRDRVAPEPNQENFGTTDDPSSMKWLINKAYQLLDGQELLFTTETPIMEGSSVRYYLDDTLLAITWKQPFRNAVYTFSEVKIAHPSQFRRFLADGQYGSDKQYLTSQMATSVNAVVASAGDFYKYRQNGLVVYNGEVERIQDNNLDSCFIDDQGDLIFSKAGELTSKEDLRTFVEDHQIRFSLSFGPILIDEGEYCVPWYYPVGEISGNFSRAALCQLGPLHYLLVTVNDEGRYVYFPTLYSFADVLLEMGIKKAYALDGGQTATIVMNDQVINRVSFGSERYISDIIYFATAMPESE